MALKIVGSSPIIHPMKKGQAVWLVLFSVKSTLWVGEIPLRGVKSGLRPGEIAAAVGGFPFTESRRLSISPKAKPLVSHFFSKKNFTKKIASPTGEAKFFYLVGELERRVTSW